MSLVKTPEVSFSNVVYLDFGVLEITNITVHNTTANGCVVNVQFSTANLTDFVIDSFKTSVGYYFFAGGGSAHITNIQITKGVGHCDSKQSLFEYKTMYFAVYSSDIEISKISIFDSNESMGLCFSLIFSNYSINNISLFLLKIGSVLISSLTFGTISEVNIDKITADMHVSVTGDNSAVSLSNITLTNSQITGRSGAIVFGKSFAAISNN